MIAEVGSKSAQDAVAGDWCTEMLCDLASGAALVIAEGRESGTVGLFDATGAVHGDLVESILAAVGRETVIFEAPQRAQQAWLLRHVGPNVNLGNIGAEDVIALETLRRGCASTRWTCCRTASRRRPESLRRGAGLRAVNAGGRRSPCERDRSRCRGCPTCARRWSQATPSP